MSEYQRDPRLTDMENLACRHAIEMQTLTAERDQFKQLLDRIYLASRRSCNALANEIEFEILQDWDVDWPSKKTALDAGGPDVNHHD